jgi:hypothetical protein
MERSKKINMISKMMTRKRLIKKKIALIMRSMSGEVRLNFKYRILLLPFLKIAKF